MNEIKQVVESLGLDWAQVQNICVWLVSLRFVLKLFSGKLQSVLENAINSAQASGDSRIIGAIAGLIQSIPYRVVAWLVDTTFSIKLPLKVVSEHGQPFPDSAS